jgi:hypothetical protein
MTPSLRGHTEKVGQNRNHHLSLFCRYVSMPNVHPDGSDHQGGALTVLGLKGGRKLVEKSNYAYESCSLTCLEIDPA